MVTAPMTTRSALPGTSAEVAQPSPMPNNAPGSMGAASLDLAYVAAGRFDGYWETALSAWDIAAGILLIREAGGYVSDWEGGSSILETGSVVAGNEYIQKALLEVAKRPIPAR